MYVYGDRDQTFVLIIEVFPIVCLILESLLEEVYIVYKTLTLYTRCLLLGFTAQLPGPGR